MTLEKYYQEYRRTLINRFQYGIFFVVEDTQVSVLAVLSMRMDVKMIKKILT